MSLEDHFDPVFASRLSLREKRTARDKATRIVHLAEMHDQRVRQGGPSFEVIACIDGRGFAVRRENMRRILLNTSGKVFTLETLDGLIANTRLREFLPRPQ